MLKRQSRREPYAAWKRAVRDLREREAELAQAIKASMGRACLETARLQREVAQMHLLTEALRHIALAGVGSPAAVIAVLPPRGLVAAVFGSAL